MDKITQDLFSSGHINEIQMERIRSRGVAEEHLLETLVKVSVISANFLKRFVVEQLKKGHYHISILEDYPFINKTSLLSYLAETLNMDFIDLDSIDIDYRLAERISLAQLIKAEAMPLSEDDAHYNIALADPMNIVSKELVQRLFPRKPIKIVIASQNQISSYLNKLEIKHSVKGLVTDIRNEMANTGMGKDEEESSSILKLIEVILRQAINSRGSDIHIEATEINCVVRTRIDGHLQEIFIFDKDIYPPLVSRIKLLSNLDIAEKRKPQDGRFSSLVGNREFDFRISTLPILTGESIVLRVLDKNNVLIKLEDSGMSKTNYQKLLKGLKAPYGIVLVTGPTGSGKTTTLYGALNELRNPEEKIITVEDPVEYRMNLVQQVQVSDKVGLTFASALRSILRQDPDKIMIGEIRDQETLRIAIQAALTGHLVISTLHTNDAISAITRIADMGIESYLISGAIVAIQAQRLVRKICPSCKENYEPIQSVLEEVKEYLPDDPQFYRGKGCKECSGTGFRGREMLSEVLTVTEKLSTLIANEASKDELLEQALKDGFKEMIANGVEKVIEGKTTIEEVLKVAKI